MDALPDVFASWAELTRYRFLDNPVSSWLAALAVSLAILLIVNVVRRYVGARAVALAARTRSNADDLVLRMLGRTRAWFVLVVSLYAGSRVLELRDGPQRLLEGLLTVGVAVQAGLWLSVALASFFERYRDRHQSDAGAATAISVMSFAGHVLIWSVVLLAALDNLGVNVTAMVAGMGIGGIAVALAVQNILGDLFASVSIIIDRPFVVGDFIIVEDYMGTVEHVGLKTTHVRSLGGEQIVFANNDLLKARVRNYKRMYERRVVFGFGVEYDTTPEQLEWIASYLRELIGQAPDVRFDRAHFFKFGDSSLDFEVVYWVKSPDYGVYMDAQQRFNLELMKAMAARGIEFAYPTRTLRLETTVAPTPSEREAPPRLERPGEGAPPRGH
jgi:small-conductance mechanosensitive channel